MNNSKRDLKNTCINCGEPKNTECGCLRNKCIKCKEPVGNIVFSICENCWDKDKTVDTFK